MKLSIISKSVAALVATICLVSGSLAAASSDSCYKKVKKHLHSANKKLDRIKQLELRLSQEAPTPITQKMMHEADGYLVLTHSGDYCLTENICGTIVIEANSVCLDLCCHTLNAKGQPNAIVANGFQGLKIFDGRIINASVAAISIDNYSAVELFKLIMNNNALDAIDITNSTDLNVHDVDFINDNSGERALLFDTCNNITVTHCNATGFLSTIGAIIQLDTCNAVSVQDVDVTGNTKISGADIDEFTPGTAFVSVDSSTGVDFVCVKVNNNTFNNNVPVSDQNSHWRTAEAIAFFSCSSCSLHQCETCNNSDVAGNLATPDTEDYMLCMLYCQNCEIIEHQANNNSSTEAIFYFNVIGILDSSNVVCDSCQANSNEVAELAVIGFLSSMYVIEAGAYFGDVPVENFVIRNCQANFNRVDNAPANPRESVFNAIRAGGSDTIIENCQANNNFVGSLSGDLFKTYCLGILAGNSLSNVLIKDCQANNNTGGEFGIGYTIVGSDVHNVKIVSCSGNSNSSFGVSFTNDNSNTPSGNIEIINSTFAQNGSANPVAPETYFGPITAAGIASFNRGAFGVAGMTNVLIKGCTILDTFSTEDTTGFPVGIYFTLNQNVVIEDTNVFNTTTASSLGGQGILLDSVTDSKIIRTQVHGNQNSGVELVGVNSNVLILDSIAVDNDIGFSVGDGSTLIEGVIQGNRAIGNISVGFEHAAVLPAPFDTGYQNNYAQNNGPAGTTNYSISSPIQLFTYDIPTATYVLVPNGASNYPTQANIDAS